MMTKYELHKYLYYDPETGKLYNKIKRNNRTKVGHEAGSIKKSSDNLYYSNVQINNIRMYAHRIIWIMNYGNIPEKMEIDHIDGDGLNNRLENLRLVTHRNNLKNQKLRNTNTSGFNGISYHKQAKKWSTEIRIGDTNLKLGLFENKEDAIKARIEANNKYGFHENHGKEKNYVSRKTGNK